MEEVRLAQRVIAAQKRETYNTDPEYRELRKAQWREYYRKNKVQRCTHAKLRVVCECVWIYLRQGKAGSSHF